MNIADKSTLDAVENIVKVLGDHHSIECTVNVEGELRRATKYYLEEGSQIFCDYNQVAVHADTGEISFNDDGYEITKSGIIDIYSYTGTDNSNITYFIR